MEPSDQELQAIARKRVQARIGFLSHAAFYVVVNAGLIIIWAAAGAHYPWFLWPLFGWGAALVAHGITLLIGPDSPFERRAIERELDRLRHRPQPQ